MSTEKNGGSYSDSRKFWAWAVPIGLVAFLVGGGFFGYALRDIFLDVKEVCSEAKSRHPGDRVEALITLIESDDASFREKNRAIWALGQLGDRRALPLLRNLDTGEIQEKPYDPNLSIVQYSVEKAIRLIEDDFSLTRWMYRFL